MNAVDDLGHVCIVGCGLIGGSMALALRRAGFRGRLTVHDREETATLAIARGVADAREDCFDRRQPCPADLLYLAAPIGGIIDFLRTNSALIRPGTLVTDAGSTKAEICRVAASVLPEGVEFIGGHPMAGSEHSGVEYARADLFDRAAYALVPTQAATPARLAQMQSLIEAIGARPLLMQADEHDRAVALVSHLPQLLASTLASLLMSQTDEDQVRVELARRMAAGGWRDMTRLAGSSFTIWRDILMTNHEFIAEALGDFLAQLQSLHEALERKDLQAVRELFLEANQSVTQLRVVHYRPFEKI